MSVRIGGTVLDTAYCEQDKPLAVSWWEVLVIEEQLWALCHLWGQKTEERAYGKWGHT